MRRPFEQRSYHAKTDALTAATVIACATIFVWSHSLIGSTQAGPSQSINPTEMMHTRKGTLPLKQ
jgi:hypothetical protein